jgi:hypothetical protein
MALVAFGAIFFVVYPLGLVWPSGWVWHGGEGKYYFQMICGVYAVLGAYLIAAARKPSEHRSLISFAIWSSVVHAGIMAAQSVPFMTNTREVTLSEMYPHYCWLLRCSGFSRQRNNRGRPWHSSRQSADRRFRLRSWREELTASISQ